MELEEKETPKLPESAYLVWSWFMRLNQCRASGGFGVSAISHQEMLAFFTLEDTWPESWELDLLRAFDRVAMEAFAEQQKKDSSSK